MKKRITSLSLLFLLPGLSFSQDLYTNGVFNGEYASTYSNGNQKATGRLEHNQRVGIWKFYAEEGKLVATIDYRSNTEFKTLETQNHLSNTLHVPLNEYDKLFLLPLEEENVLWAKRVYRDIPLAEFKLDPGFDFFHHLETIQTEKDLYFADDQFKTRINHPDSIPHVGETITGYRIKLDYFFRTDFNFMDFRIVGIAPLYQTKEGKTQEICWLYYHGLKDLVFEKIVNKEGQSMEDVLQTKHYHSHIHKEFTMASKLVGEIAKDEEKQKAFSREIDYSLLNVENVHHQIVSLGLEQNPFSPY